MKNRIMWAVCLSCGAMTGVLMLPIELFVETLAWCLGAKDASFRSVGFVFRQFTCIRSLKEMYPL